MLLSRRPYGPRYRALLAQYQQPFSLLYAQHRCFSPSFAPPCLPTQAMYGMQPKRSMLPSMSVERGVVYLVGAGPGDPGLLTLRAQEVLTQADCVVYDYLMHPQILDHLPARCERLFVGKKGGAQAAGQDAINALLCRVAGPDRVVVRLKGGDPFCFGRGGEEARALRRANIPFRLIPGVTSGIAAPAYAGIPITDRELSSSVCFLTGTEKPGSDRHDWQALARVGTLVIYMGVRRCGEICAALRAAGKSSDTPVAAIRWGTWPHQQVLVGTLQDFPERVQRQDLQSPAIIVIGPVAALHRELDWRPARPLAGRSLVVAGVQRSDPLTLGLEQQGARVIHCPGLAVDVAMSVDPEALAEKVTSSAWLVFTSAAAVRHFFSLCLTVFGDVRRLAHCSIAVIGPSCAAALQHYHCRADLIPDVHDSQHLAQALLSAGAQQAGRMLYPCQQEGGRRLHQLLTQAACAVERVAVYRHESPAQVMQLLDETVHGVCLSSPSAVRRLGDSLGPQALQELLRQRPTFFAIGKSTGAAMVERGLPVDAIAPQAHTASLVDMITAHFAPGTIL